MVEASHQIPPCRILHQLPLSTLKRVKKEKKSITITRRKQYRKAVFNFSAESDPHTQQEHRKCIQRLTTLVMAEGFGCLTMMILEVGLVFCSVSSWRWALHIKLFHTLFIYLHHAITQLPEFMREFAALAWNEFGWSKHARRRGWSDTSRFVADVEAVLIPTSSRP